ncbi:family 16 glycosylhydrolase [Clostridium sp. 'White wine YQ']|uniref:family 16 glycosylhydrolase n=1 Tax=Clostridium sp. 'White wine YQ' TaxID=3027474 RepID=UPI00236651CE|nr:family 16 glycosylhydrolase [Clostridium sp. 'White wine YQ']MDD7793393.1 family 16 glycosylhydrolase [Clostridium sp. 'White wine YQ']
MIKKKLVIATVLSALVLGASVNTIPAKASITDKWVQVWGDDFNVPDGTPIDRTKWGFDIGAGGWGNNELEYYTDRPQNAYIQGGNLVIQANKENYNGAQYTSARMLTKNTFNFKYGRVEMRAKIPYGQGIWPAFWMLGSNIDQPNKGWPNCGEIDIMENIGKEPNVVHGTIHGPGYSADKGIGAAYTNSTAFSNDYHTYAVEFEPSVIKWYVDGNLYETRTPKDVGGNEWVFNQPFFILMNLAVGGGWPGYPDASTVFPQKYLIDYVHVYQRANGYNIVSLKAAANGQYVTADNGGDSALIANRTAPSLWEQFEQIDLGNGNIALRSLANNKYVCADNYGNNPLIANKDAIGTWETFHLETLPDGKKALKAVVNNKYVCADNYGNNPLIANRDSASGWEAFDFISQ